MITTARRKDFRKTETKILKNTSEIVYHTGLLKYEVVELSVDDVKQNGIIASSIPPVSGTYPKGFEKAPVILSDKAQELIDEHIKFLQANGLSIFSKSPLFPVAKTNKRYDESKLWRSLSKYCIYNSYERYRKAGIHYLCWELSKDGVSKQQIIDAAHRFSRYSNIERTGKLVEEGISRDPKAYERDYRNSQKAAGRLITFHEIRSDKVNQYISELQLSLNLLLNRDQKTILNYANKVLKESKKQILMADNSLVIEEITQYRISPSMIKKRKRKKFK